MAYRRLTNVIVFYSSKSTLMQVVECLFLSPRKLTDDALRFFVKKSKTNDFIRQQLQKAYLECLYDLDVLQVLARQYETVYNTIAGAHEGSDRLTGSQCDSLMRIMVPSEVYGLRRVPVVVPYYARILRRMSIPGSGLAAGVKAFYDLEGIDAGKLSNLQAAQKQLEKRVCVPLQLFEGETGGTSRAVILGIVNDSSPQDSRGKACRPRTLPSEYWIGLIEAPVPPEWNLLPKRVLPPDDPFHSIKWE